MSEQLRKPCRKCRARSGHPCTTPTGRETKPHAERLRDEHAVDAAPGLAGYRAGCRCSTCTDANTDAKARERERRRQREEEEARAVAKTALRVVADGETALPSPDGGWEPEPFTVAEHLLLALTEIPGDDPLTRYRKAHAITLAQVLDNPAAFRSWAGITRALLTVMVLLVKDAGPVDNEGEALKEFFALIAQGRPQSG